MFFDRKTSVDRIEKEFKINNLRDKHVFYDLNVRCGDPEELRSFTAELVSDLEFKPVLNELTKFDDSDIENVLRGGRLKPIKGLLKAEREIIKGPKFSLLWKFFAFLGLLSLLFYFATTANLVDLHFNQTLLLVVSSSLLVLAVLVRTIKERIILSLWIKTVGVYDVEDESSDVRIVISAGSEKKDKQAYNTLEESVGEIYNVLAGKYIKSKPRKLLKGLTKKKDETSAQSILNALQKVEVDLDNVSSRLASGEITEATYNEVKEKLLKKKEKLETIQELLQVLK